MKNYTYGWKLYDMGYVELATDYYCNRMWDMKGYIKLLSNVIAASKCGWDGVEYKVMVDQEGYYTEYMILCVDGHEERWIPIDGNSKACNFSVLGENLW